MKLKEAKRFHEVGAIKSFRAVRNPLNHFWNLQILKINGTIDYLSTYRNDQLDLKAYKTLDSLSQDVKRIGGPKTKLTIYNS